jgi:hypothetical protein
MRHPRSTAAALALCLCAPAAAAQTVDYDAAFADAARLEHSGDPRAAAAALTALAAAFPEDHAVALRLAWLTFSAADYAAARRHYERALALSGDASVDARLGLAWTLFRLGDFAAARARFEALAADPVAGPSARQGAAIARAAEPRALRAWAGLYVGAQLYANHPQRRLSLSVTPTLALQFNDLVVAGVTYRAVDYDLNTMPQPGRPPTASRYLQQELYASVGVVRPDFVARLHYGRLWDPQNTFAPADIFGASLRLSFHGVVSAEASVAAFADETVGRVAGSWAAALSPRWSIGPTASLQGSGTGAGGSIGALLAYQRDGYAFSLSARIPLGRGISLAPSYDWLHLTTGDALRSTDADAHFLTLGVLGAW